MRLLQNKRRAAALMVATTALILTQAATHYMDYSYDTCYNEDTPGQSTRISSMWTAYRA